MKKIKIKGIILLIIILLVIILFFINKSQFGDQQEDQLIIDTLRSVQEYWDSTPHLNRGILLNSLNNVTAAHCFWYVYMLDSTIEDINTETIISQFLEVFPPKIQDILIDTFMVCNQIKTVLNSAILAQLKKDNGWNDTTMKTLFDTINNSYIKKVIPAGGSVLNWLPVSWLIYKANLISWFQNKMTGIQQSITDIFDKNPELLNPDAPLSGSVDIDSLNETAISNIDDLEEFTVTDPLRTMINGTRDALGALRDTEAAEEAVSEGIAAGADVAETAAESEGGANPVLDALAVVTLLVQGIDWLVDWESNKWKYCDADYPFLQDKVAPICYRGSCNDQYGGNYVNESAGLCGLDCRAKYGHCYYNDGDLVCTKKGDCFHGPVSHTRDSKTIGGTSAASEKPRPTTWGNNNYSDYSTNNLNNACKYGYSKVCNSLRDTVPLWTIYNVLKGQGLAF